MVLGFIGLNQALLTGGQPLLSAAPSWGLLQSQLRTSLREWGLHETLPSPYVGAEMMTHPCNLSPSEAEAGGSGVQHLPGWHGHLLSKEKEQCAQIVLKLNF